MPRERFYHPELDVMRFGAFLLVFLAHVLPYREGLREMGASKAVEKTILAVKVGGGFGVDVFSFSPPISLRSFCCVSFEAGGP